MFIILINNLRTLKGRLHNTVQKKYIQIYVFERNFIQPENIIVEFNYGELYMQFVNGFRYKVGH